MKINKNIFEKQFQDLAIQEGVALKIKYEPGYSKLITFAPMTDYNDNLRVKSFTLDLPYKSHTIYISYEVGDLKLGHIVSELKETTISSFKIYAQSHFWRIFNNKSNILKIVTSDKKLKQSLEKMLLNIELESIARKSQFSQIIKGYRTKNHFKITTEFPLSFDAKLEVLLPIINFYKGLIDDFISN
ncbi:hypothetical protein [Winogradskyella algicola]|uniref:hypothetical protein n=1 Tax=Winogradskyella algicola TaxID=2575815 RepID=UPI0011094AA6|nr:hypothetical protein [Winogradskyella algicola]